MVSRTVFSRGVDKEDGVKTRTRMEFAETWLQVSAMLALPERASEYTDWLEQLRLRPSMVDTLERAYTPSWEECNGIIKARFEDVALPNARPIRAQNPLLTERLRGVTERLEYAAQANFRWSAFDTLLQHYHFWERLGPQIDSTADWRGSQLDVGRPDILPRLNLVNGSAVVDYESAFPEAQAMFDRLRGHLFQSPGFGPVRPSSLSVPALLTGLVLADFQRELPQSVREPFADICGRLLDIRTPNSARIVLYRRLHDLVVEAWSGRPSSNAARLFQLLRDLDVEVSATSATEEELAKAHVLLSLHGGDCPGAGWTARRLLHTICRNAVILACGGRTPLASKTLGLDQTGIPSEAAEMMMAAMIPRFDDPFAMMPGAEDRSWEYGPVSPTRFLPPDTRSNDTPSNVANANAALTAYHHILGGHEPLNVYILSAPPHLKRAVVEFRNGISPKVACFGTYGVRAAQLDYTGHNVLPAGILNWFGEASKELYMTCVL